MTPLSSTGRRCGDVGRQVKKASPALDPSAPSFLPPSRHRPLQYAVVLPPTPPLSLVRVHFPHHQAWLHHPHYLAGFNHHLQKLPLHNPNPRPRPLPLPHPIRHEDKEHLLPRSVENERMASKTRSSVPGPLLENKRWIRRMNKRGPRNDRCSAPTEASETVTQTDQSVSCGLSGGVTTLMIRNLPNLFRREDLLVILDKHCREVNSKLDEAENTTASSSEQKVRSEYDFVYLPFDFRQNMNLGYAFVNFTTPIAAVRMFRAFHGWGWKGYWSDAHIRPLNSRKVCEINPASIQGRAALDYHLGKREYPREEFQPVAAMEKPCDGNGRKMLLVGSHRDVVGPLHRGGRRRWKQFGR